MVLKEIIYSVSTVLLYAYLAIQFPPLSIVGLLIPAFSVLNSEKCSFFAKALGAPLMIGAHLFGTFQQIKIVEILAFLGILVLSFSEVPAAKQRPKIDSKATGKEGLPSPKRGTQSVAFLLPEVNSPTTHQSAPPTSPRLTKSAEKRKKDREILKRVMLEAQQAQLERQNEVTRKLLSPSK